MKEVNKLKEEWRRIQSEGDSIEVSNFGEVKRDGVHIKKRVNHDGYYVVSLRNPTRSKGVARLVAEAFLEKPNDYEVFEVNHKDYDRKNNVVTNLEWLTHADNVRYSVCNKPDLTGDKNPNWGNKKLSKIYKENKELSLEKQSRKGAVNGRSVKVRLFEDGVFIKEFDYVGACCEYMIENGMTTSTVDSMRIRIRECAKKGIKYKGKYTFEKIDT